MDEISNGYIQRYFLKNLKKEVSESQHLAEIRRDIIRNFTLNKNQIHI